MVVDFDGQLLIPNGDVKDFAVVACDQFSSSPEYWNKLADELPPLSALDVILPECFLSEAQNRLPSVVAASRKMLDSGRFESMRGAVYVTRKTPYGRTRHGVVASIDLADYDYKQGSKTLIRASERTIEERIPPRVKIREAIDIELPHIMLLVDDINDELGKACRAAQKRVVYDGELCGNGGHVTGELITRTDGLYKAVDRIIANMTQKLGQPLFALVGDGNHSLATAKYCSQAKPTPLNGRALVEIVNIYDEGLVCEPIHRLVKVDDPVMFTDSLRSGLKGGGKCELWSANGKAMELDVPDDKIEAIKAVDRLAETYVKHFGGYIEYVHGDDALRREGWLGLKMRGIQKSELFEYVIKNGVLPKKTFSLGEAEEKRYYIEARLIK